MEKLLIKSERKIREVKLDFQRYLFKEINFNQRMISILGARGVGKTTLLLQIAKKSEFSNILYLALDDLFFNENTLYSLAEEFVLNGGELLLLDEVHKYPQWSRELKLIYDDFPNLKVIFTSSSILDIYKGESDLSRRAVSYNLKELSFREFLNFYHNFRFEKLSLDEIIKNHKEYAFEISKQIKPIKYLNEFYKIGAYPYYENNTADYYQKIMNIINLIMDVDIQGIEGISYEHIAKFKRLLYVLSTNVPFTPNISKLADKLQMHRNKLVHALQLLERAELIYTLIKTNKSVSILNKPDKIWLHNTNLNYLFSDNKPNTGNLRETFFIHHTHHNHIISLAEKGDFIINNKFTFEVGGKNKSKKQIANIPNSFVVRDNIEIGTMNIIPLWLFGLMY